MFQYFPFLRHCFPALCVCVFVCVCVLCGLTSRGSNKWCEMKRAVPNPTSERDREDCGTANGQQAKSLLDRREKFIGFGDTNPR